MVKKLREYKRGDFIFAKVKGYPAWPARVKGINGKKYFVHFYGTGETANLTANVLFDYAENKDKLTKNVKRKFFTEGVQQIDYDFANNVPLEEDDAEPAQPSTSESMDDSGTADTSANDTADETIADTTVADTTAADTTVADTTVADTTAADTTVDQSMETNQNDTAVEDSDEGALVIDETKKPKAKKPKLEASTPKPSKEKEPKEKEPKEKEPKEKEPKEKEPKEKETREPRTPRAQKKAAAAAAEAEEKKESKEEVVSRSGRKIRPKRYLEEAVEEVATPAKRRRAGTPPAERSPEKPQEPEKPVKFNFLTKNDLRDITQPFSDESEGETLRHVVVARRPDGRYVGVKLFAERGAGGAGAAARLAAARASAERALQLKRDIESGKVKTKEVQNQLVLDLNLSDEEKLNMDKEWELEEKKHKMAFLSTEFSLLEQDSKIKTCINLERADPEQCLTLLDELLEMDVQPLMLIKHPSSLETIKRLRCYVGNMVSWGLNAEEEAAFKKKAHLIRSRADRVFNKFKELFETPESVEFWEYFSQRVMLFKQCTAELTEPQLYSLVREPSAMVEQPSFTPTVTENDVAAETNDIAENNDKVTDNETPENDDQEKTKEKEKPADKKKAGKQKSEDDKEKNSKEKGTKETEEKEKLNEEEKSEEQEKVGEAETVENNEKANSKEKGDKEKTDEVSSKETQSKKKDSSLDKAQKSNVSDKPDRSDRGERSLKRQSSRWGESTEGEKKNGQEERERDGGRSKRETRESKEMKSQEDKSEKSERTPKRQSSRKAEAEEGEKKNGREEDKEERDSGSKRETRDSKESAKKTDSAVKTPTKRKAKS